MLVENLIITRTSGRASIDDLVQAIDQCAPRPATLISPLGQEEFVLILDIHRPYARACAAMGFSARHLSFEEFPAHKYFPDWALLLSLHDRLRIYACLWRREAQSSAAAEAGVM